MKLLDWIVILGYLLGLIAIGVYYARRTTSTDDYLLGGRIMKSFPVGISLFATLISTNTYLSMPGEMIQHGPMAFTKVLAYPIAFLIGAYALIPFLMRLRVTSAYELLERRFGLSVRLLASVMFLAGRLLWMGLILFGLVGAMVVPVLGLPDWTTPLICAVLGLITVAYTSFGGLRAVVLVDVIQSAILLLGAILTVVVITFTFGGVGSWWPKAWPEHWDTFQIGFDSTARFTLFSAGLSQLIWWVCTSGSDQMAIQRYMATKDRGTAQQVLGYSLSASFFTMLLLALVGMAVMAFFLAHPQDLAPDTIDSDSASSLFPRFIVLGLPQGITGLVIAGILAAAMSSLSSGFNSSSLVISVDFFDRLGWGARDEAHRIRRTKAISWCVGLLSVGSSLLAGGIPGNLLEQTYRTSNLLVAPLFIPFFMSFFVPWATTLGVWSGVLAALYVATRVAFFSDYGVNFLYAPETSVNVVWIMPASLAAGIVVGCLASLLPIGRARGELPAPIVDK